MKNRLNDIGINIHWIHDKQTFPGWKDIRQSVGFHSFYWIHEGRGTFHTDEEIAIEAGMLLYLKPGLQMAMEADMHYPLRITMVLLSLFTASENPIGNWEAVLLPELPTLPFSIKYESDQAKEYDVLFKKLAEEWVPGLAGGELLAKGYIYQILYKTHRQIQSGETGKDSSSAIVMKVKHELERNYNEPIRLYELASQHQISLSYLRNLFQRHLGQSPKSYLSALRNEHAKKQLLYSNLTMKEIAENCGYADEFHFSKSFKQYSGMSPRAFRSKDDG